MTNDYAPDLRQAVQSPTLTRASTRVCRACVGRPNDLTPRGRLVDSKLCDFVRRKVAVPSPPSSPHLRSGFGWRRLPCAGSPVNMCLSRRVFEANFFSPRLKRREA